MLPILDPLPRGVLLALLSVAGVTIGASFLLSTAPPPSPDLLRTAAVIGASFVIAYAIEAAWLVSRVEITDDHEEWLGFLTGVGIAGLLAVLIALLLAEHLAAGHDNFLDDLGTGWIFGSLAILGGVLVLQPLLADRFRGSDEGS